MYVNTLRLTVRHDESEPTLAMLSVEGALNSMRFERNAQVAFVEAGVKLAASSEAPELRRDHGIDLADAVDQLDELGVKAFACADCAEGHGVAASGGLLRQLEWLPSEDVRLPLHDCSKKRQGAGAQKISIEDQRREQRVFDELVGQPTIGADRGEG